MTTKAELRRLVLSHLTVIDPEDSPSPGQASKLDLYVDGVRATLLQRGLCWWDENDIPAEVSIPLMQYIASQCCSAFGKRGKGFELQAAPAWKAIAALKSSEERETSRTEYF